MTPESVSLIPVLLAMGTTLMLLWHLNWRWTLGALAIQFIAVFWMVSQNWSLGLSLVKVVVGLVSSGVLSASMQSTFESKVKDDLYGRIFRSLVLIFIWIIIYFIGPVIQSWLPIKQNLLWGALILVGSGLIQLGMTIQPIRVAIGLLTFLAGFEVLYSAIENSVLVAGLLAIVNLGIALGGTYLASTPEKETVV